VFVKPVEAFSDASGALGRGSFWLADTPEPDIPLTCNLLIGVERGMTYMSHAICASRQDLEPWGLN